MDQQQAKTIKQSLLDEKASLLIEFQQHQPIGSLVTRLCRYVDDMLQQAWQQGSLDQDKICLIAVGGYGRGELHPYSDVDLLFLVSEPPQDATRTALEELIAFLWDSGLEIGHSVRTVDETLTLAGDDISVVTNLLESRLLCGSPVLFNTLYHRIREADFWPSNEFFIGKRDEQSQRHEKANAFDLEPNIKTCPGGLRDIQSVAWVAMRHFDASTLEELVHHEFLTQSELDELLECQSFLWQLRFALHCISGRDENRMLFHLQRQVAELMGYEDETQLAVEQMMKQYYRTIRRVLELNEMLLQLFKRATLGRLQQLSFNNIDSKYQRRGRFIESLQEGIFDRPEEILRIFLYIANNSNIKGIYAPTLRSLRQARRSQQAPLMTHPECRRVFMEILKHPRGIAALSLMHKHGIMSAYLPAWRKIEGQMQFDLFHAYTVDEHTHRVLLNIANFTTSEQKDKFPLASMLVSKVPKIGLLVLGGIFHDIAKGRGGNHSKLGAVDALEFCSLHKLNDHDGRLVSWLVEHHLLMSITAQHKDISDPDVVAKFAAQVTDSAHLNYLYCLTVADICATSESTWNNWKGALLRELYFSTQRVLAKGREMPVDILARMEEYRNKAKKMMLRRGLKEKDIDKLWVNFRTDYFLRQQPNQLAWHGEAIIKHKHKSALVLISKHTLRGGTELFVYERDKPKLFSTIMAVLDNKNITVHDANIITSKDNYVLDSFIIMEQNGQPVTQLSRILSIRKALEKALANKPKLPKFRKLPRKMRNFQVPTQVNFVAGSKPNTSLMEVISLDSPGMLSQVGEIFDLCQVKLLAAKITTTGEKAADFFTLQNMAGEPLNETQETRLTQALIHALVQPES